VEEGVRAITHEVFFNDPGHLPLAIGTLVVLYDEPLLARIPSLERLSLFGGAFEVEHASYRRVDVAVFVLVFTDQDVDSHGSS
jgi:hypothetical protein